MYKLTISNLPPEVSSEARPVAVDWIMDSSHTHLVQFMLGCRLATDKQHVVVC